MSYSVVRPLAVPVRVRSSAAARTVLTRGRSAGLDAPRRPSAQPSAQGEDVTGWTFLAFWFVVGLLVGVALMKSSLGHSPAFAHLAKEIRAVLLAR